MTSVPWGVVTLTESCVGGQPRGEPVTRACYDDMVERIRARSAPFCAKHGIGGADRARRGPDGRRLGHGDDGQRPSISG